MKKKMRILPVLLAATMASAMMPMLGAGEVQAATGDPAICLVADGSAPNITDGGGAGDKGGIYFGSYPQSEITDIEGLTENKDYVKAKNDKYYRMEPVKWRVLEKGEKIYYTDSENPVKYNGLLLLADQNLDVMRYNESQTRITWENCTMRKWLNGDGSYKDDYGKGGFLSNAFSDGEQSAIPTTRVVNADNPDYGTSGGNNTGDKVFLLSIEEAKNTDYGFDDIGTRKATDTKYVADGGRIYSTSRVGVAGFWWLRSPADYDYGAAVVGGVGDVISSGGLVDNAIFAVRPALNINLESLIFTSAAKGGKSSNGVSADSLKPVETNTTDEWKLTIKDDSCKDFSVYTCESTYDSETGEVKVIWEDPAKVSNDNYISAIITDSKKQTVKYYGRLLKPSGVSGETGVVTINTKDKLSDGDRLFVFNEIISPDKETDYASDLHEIELDKLGHSFDQEKVENVYLKSAATCTAPAEYYVSCSKCGLSSKSQGNNEATFTSGNALGHDYHEVPNSAKEPTCTKPGKEADEKCSRCDDVVAGKIITAKGHDEVVVKGTAQTCTKTGLTDGKHCSVCKTVLVKQNIITAKGHRWDKGKVTKAATEKAEGTKTYTCTVCKATKTETIQKLKHSHNLVMKTKVRPTCTAPGRSAYWICSGCGQMFSDGNGKNEISNPVEIKATGHKYGAWKKLSATQHQKICEHDKSHVVKENHKWDGGKVTKEATEKAAGTKTYTCTVCKATKTESIPKLKPSAKNGWFHIEGSWKYFKDDKYYTGWHWMGKTEGEKTEHWSYFDERGFLLTGWQWMDKTRGEKTPHWSYFGGNGWLHTGWQWMDKTRGEKIPHWSYFGENGWLRTGWQQMGKGTNNPDGKNVKHWSYFGGNGWLHTGWQWMDKTRGEKTPHWSYFGENGWLRTGWQWMDKTRGEKTPHWSYFGENGWLRTGWQQMGKGTNNPDGKNVKHWSYFGSNGWLRTRMKTLGQADGEKVTHKSYFGGNGWLVTNRIFSVAGKTYVADARGWIK